MALIGRAVLILSLLVALFGVGASLYGVRRGRREWVDSGRRGVYVLFGLALTAFVILESAFLRSDFSFNVVAAHSSTTTPAFYKATAPWSSQEGSLLLWVLLLSGWSSLVLRLTAHRVREIAPYATAVLLGFGTFFTALMVFYANPFATSASPPSEGAGLDPLLLHPSMMFHPPMLYSGYTLMTVPFAFAIGALITGRLGNDWISVTRRFALAAWLCLGIGILLGARWSYTELGWGGYWAWDAVENAALMPWLAITAFIHSVMIQEKRGMLKVWNISLILAAGTLAVLGTFLVRSGILDSIHAFGASTLGVPFVILIAVMMFGGGGLVYRRRVGLASESRLDSLLSREAVFLLQNLVLVAMIFVIFWVTFFPLISEAVTGVKRSVGPPAFTPYMVPLALVLVLLSGIGPIIAWRRVTVANLRRNLAAPLGVGVGAALVILATGSGDGHWRAVLMFGLGVFVLAGVVQEFVRGVGARRAVSGEAVPAALVALVQRNRRRYGGYIVHAGFALLMIGVAGSSSFQHSRDVTLAPGQSAVVDGYTMHYVRPVARATPQKLTFGAVLSVTHGGSRVATLTTTRGYYPSQDVTLGILGRFFNGSADSTVGLQAGLTHDVWTVVNPGNLGPLQPQIARGDALFRSAMLATVGQGGMTSVKAQKAVKVLFGLRDRAVQGLVGQFIAHPWPIEFRLIVSPLVSWLWLGAIVMAAGGLIALWPLPATLRRRRLLTVPTGTGRLAGEPV